MAKPTGPPCPYCRHVMFPIHFGWFCLARRADMPGDRACGTTVGDATRIMFT